MELAKEGHESTARKGALNDLVCSQKPVPEGWVGHLRCGKPGATGPFFRGAWGM